MSWSAELLALTRCALVLGDWLVEHRDVMPAFGPFEVLLKLEQQLVAVPRPDGPERAALHRDAYHIHRNTFTLFGGDSIEYQFAGAAAQITFAHEMTSDQMVHYATRWLSFAFDKAGTPAGTFDATYADALKDAEKVVARVEAARDAYDAERA